MAAAPIAAAQDAPAPQRKAASEVEPFAGPIEFRRSDVAPRVREFPMSSVRLTGGVYQQAEQWNHAYLNRLPVDRLVHNFRVTAGLPSSATPLGGWEEPKGELRGHFVGHYLSACALTWASTGDAAIKTKGDEIVAELAKCQARLAGGYLSAYPTEFYDRLDARQKVWAPFYTYHKIVAGMFDMYRLAGNKQALEVAQGMAAWTDSWTARHSEEHMQDILTTEYGGMNDILYLLARATNDEKWARVGDRFTKKKFFNPLAMRRDQLRGLHVNTHVPQVIGAARRYELSGDMRFHDVADYFWSDVVGARTYVTGGTSNGEVWSVLPRRLAEELKHSVNTAECCCVYNQMKLTRELYSWTGDPRYFDYYERTLLNHRIGTIHPETGATMYYLSHTPGAFKTFGTEDQSFWCCTGTGVEEYAKLNDSIYYHDDEGLYVNLFVPSELNWSERGVRVRQQTRFPEEAGTAISFTVAKPVRMAVRVRIPEWAHGATAKINGRAIEAMASPGSYLAITREWRSGDKVELTLPMRLRVEAMPDDGGLQAFLYGPLVLAGDLGKEGLTEQLMIGPSGPRMRGTTVSVPELRAASGDPASWIRPADGPLAFRTTGQARDIALSPLNSIFDRRYSIYWRVTRS